MKRKQNEYHLRFPYRRMVLTSFFSVIIVMTLVIVYSINLFDVWHNRDVIDLKDNYIEFQDELEELMQTGAMLIVGYETLIRIEGSELPESSEEFLTELTKDDMIYLRNIAVIQDTTIVYNFPIEGNEKSIGIDLAEVEDQKEYIFKTKNELVRVFQGPVDLVQGGQGYINRVPLTNKDGSYWGQASIVLKADVINEKIMEIADHEQLKVAIFSDTEHTELIVGDEKILDQQPMMFISENINDWVIYVSPIEGWRNYIFRVMLILFMGLLLGLFIGFLIYYFQKSHYDVIEVMAHDQLTGLYNRHHLEMVHKQLTDTSKEGNKQYGLMHMDLDNFKSINDEYGHLTGDYVLSSVGAALRTITRAEDLVFRVGGDEFLVLMPFVNSAEELAYMKGRLQKDFAKLFSEDKLMKKINISMGAGLYPDDGLNFDQVLKFADVKMYEAKSRHKAR